MGLISELFIVITVATSFFVVGYVWQRRSMPGALPLTGVVLIVGLRALIELMIFHTRGADQQWWLWHMGDAINIIAPLLWVLMIIEFYRDSKDTPRWILLLFTLDLLLFQVMLWSHGSLHHLLYSGVDVRHVGEMTLLIPENGPIRKAYLLWRLLLMLISVGLLLKLCLGSGSDVRRRQAWLLLVSTIALSVIVSMHKAHLLPIESVPPALLLSSLILVAAVSRYRLFEILPEARARLVEQIPDGVLVLDRDRRVLDCNPVAGQYLGVSRDALIGKPLHVPWSERMSWQWQAGDSQVNVHEFELERGLHVEARQLPLCDRKRHLAGWLIVLHDITVRREVELERRLYTEAVERASHELQQLDAMKTRFFANIAHEFRTPLTLSMGPIDDLLHGDGAAAELSEGSRQSLQLSLRNTQRLLKLVNQLLDLAKLEAGGMQLNASPRDMAAFLRLIAAHFESLAEQRQIGLKVHVETDVTMASFDADKMEQVMTNLLANACKFTPAGGSIDISLDGDEREIVIAVRDSGPGIDPEAISHLFDRFYQAEARASGQDEAGTGIGLTLVRELVQLHDGTIRVESEPGEGTCFTIRLPRGDVAAQGREGQPDPQSQEMPVEIKAEEIDGVASTAGQVPCGEAVILLVEDNSDMRHYIRSHLGADYRLIEAANGTEGLALAHEAIPDLIISDLMMPEMNGLELCRAIRANANTDHIPVILLTAMADQDSRLQGLETGADDYITKPFTARELQLRITNMLNSRRLLRQRYTTEQQADSPPQAQDRFIRMLEETIEMHLSDEKFQVGVLAASVSMSERHLQRKLRALTGETPSELIRRYRLQRAAQMLREGSSASQACFAVGFNNTSYFSRCFKQQFDCTPSEFIKVMA